MNIGNMAKGMNDVERFDCTNGGAQWCNGCYRMDRDEMGEYVRYEDYESLQQQLAASKAEYSEAAQLCGKLADRADKAEQQLAAAREAMNRIQRVSETGTAKSFLALSDDDKCKWFAMALDESTRRKHAEELLDSGCIVTYDRDEFGEEQRTLRCGLNLRAAIQIGIDESAVYDALKTLQRDRQP